MCFPERESDKYTSEVFVVLSDLNDVEKVLKMNGKKVDSSVIKMFRSCQEQLEYRCASPDSALSISPDFEAQPDIPNNNNTEKRLSPETESGNMNAEWIRVSAPEIFPSKEPKTVDAVNKDNLIKPLSLKVLNNSTLSKKSIIPSENPPTLSTTPILSEFKENFYNGSGYNAAPYVLQSNGFPWSMSKEEILQFFAGVRILNETNGIHFIIDNRLNKCNKLYIQLATENDYRKAQCYNNRKLNGLNIEGNCIKPDRYF